MDSAFFPRVSAFFPAVLSTFEYCSLQVLTFVASSFAIFWKNMACTLGSSSSMNSRVIFTT